MNGNRTNVYREFHVTRHVARHSRFVQQYLVIKSTIDLFENEKIGLNDAATKKRKSELEKQLRDLKNGNKDWTLRFPNAYLKDLKNELEVLRKDTRDLVYLIKETSGREMYVIDDEVLFYRLVKQFKFDDFTCSDFEYIKIIEFKMQNQDFKVDVNEAYEQMEILGCAILNLRNAIFLYEKYIELEKIEK